MSQALPGEHYCLSHQGNHSHYDPHNCTVCRLRAALRYVWENSEDRSLAPNLTFEEWLSEAIAGGKE